jgi:hypothetical protein
MKKRVYSLLIFCLIFSVSSCSYLDIVPDNIPTIDDAFETRAAAERYLFTCFHYLPNMTYGNSNPAIFGSDEVWWNIDKTISTLNIYQNYTNAVYLARGQQSSTSPLMNYWDGGNGGTNLWQAIRDCNIFLENIDKPYDLEPYEKQQWVAEVKFLKAYYHYFLFRLYGPIPITDTNLSINSSPNEVRVYRNTTDEVVDYICKLLDEATIDLPLKIQNMASDAGRPTQAMALALKAKVLTLAASPLFNGNKDYENYKDNRGVSIFGNNVGTVDMTKWQRAATAIKNAIDTCQLAGNKLYTYTKIYNMSDTTVLKMSIRGCVSEKWNQEIIWGSTTSNFLQQHFMPRFETTNTNQNSDHGMTLKCAETFYSNNGVPINEDKTYDYANRYKTGVAGPADRFYIKEGETTAKLNFNREPRYYATLGFDRGIWEGGGRVDDTNSWYLQARKGEIPGTETAGHVPTGIFNKKVVNYESSYSNWNYNEIQYSFPLIRLADLYLLYAEVLNEIKSVPDDEVYYWVDLVRARAGLKGVVESWANYSNNPTKPLSQIGMREIIHQERNNEFMGEFQRFWDVRRWKKATEEYNLCPMQGWNFYGTTAESYTNIFTMYNGRQYAMKDYLWPLSNSAILVNPDLVQNPGW